MSDTKRQHLSKSEDETYHEVVEVECIICGDIYIAELDEPIICLPCKHGFTNAAELAKTHREP